MCLSMFPHLATQQLAAPAGLGVLQVPCDAASLLAAIPVSKLHMLVICLLACANLLTQLDWYVS